MTYRDVYIGELGDDEALDWGGTFERGNAPVRIGPFFPHTARTVPWDLLRRQIDARRLTGERVDWGAVVARVTVDDIRAFAHDCYGSEVPAEVAEFVESLEPTRRYALVASEL